MPSTHIKSWVGHSSAYMEIGRSLRGHGAARLADKLQFQGEACLKK